VAIRLTLILSGKAYEEHEFDSFDSVRIGRGEDCEVRIDNLGVSRLHCSISSRGGTYQLRNMNQRGGTRVNGVKVDTYNLNDGDAITLGKFTIAFASDDDWGGGGAGGVAGNTISQATLGDTGAVRKAMESSLNRALGYLELATDSRDPDVRLLSNAFFLIGKDPDSDVLIEGWGAPRVAAVVIRDSSGFEAMAVSPKGGSLVLNGSPSKSARLSDGDVIEIRGMSMVFHSGTPEV
jgi:hypothetical protein